MQSFKEFVGATSNLPTEEEIFQAGQTQRGYPEGKMLEVCRKIQEIGGPPTLVDALEHIGDLAERASEKNSIINVEEKITMPRRRLNDALVQMRNWWDELKYQYEDAATSRLLHADPKLEAEWKLEHGDPKRRKNWQIWQDAAAKPEHKALVRKIKDTTKALMKEYADSHIKYNKPITTLGRLGKDAAVALGLQEYGQLRDILNEIHNWLERYKTASDEEQDIMFRS